MNASSEYKSFMGGSLEGSKVTSLPLGPAPGGGLASAEATWGEGTPSCLAVSEATAKAFLGALDVRSLEEFNGLPGTMQHGSTEL